MNDHDPNTIRQREIPFTRGGSTGLGRDVPVFQSEILTNALRYMRLMRENLISYREQDPEL